MQAASSANRIRATVVINLGRPGMIGGSEPPTFEARVLPDQRGDGLFEVRLRVPTWIALCGTYSLGSHAPGVAGTRSTAVLRRARFD
jgi:hypothetical protein